MRRVPTAGGPPRSPMRRKEGPLPYGPGGARYGELGRPAGGYPSHGALVAGFGIRMIRGVPAAQRGRGGGNNYQQVVGAAGLQRQYMRDGRG